MTKLKKISIRYDPPGMLIECVVSSNEAMRIHKDLPPAEEITSLELIRALADLIIEECEDGLLEKHEKRLIELLGRLYKIDVAAAAEEEPEDEQEKDTIEEQDDDEKNISEDACRVETTAEPTDWKTEEEEEEAVEQDEEVVEPPTPAPAAVGAEPIFPVELPCPEEAEATPPDPGYDPGATFSATSPKMIPEDAAPAQDRGRGAAGETMRTIAAPSSCSTRFCTSRLSCGEEVIQPPTPAAGGAEPPTPMLGSRKEREDDDDEAAPTSASFPLGTRCVCVGLRPGRDKKEPVGSRRRAVELQLLNGMLGTISAVHAPHNPRSGETPPAPTMYLVSFDCGLQLPVNPEDLLQVLNDGFPFKAGLLKAGTLVVVCGLENHEALNGMVGRITGVWTNYESFRYEVECLDHTGRRFRVRPEKVLAALPLVEGAEIPSALVEAVRKERDEAEEALRQLAAKAGTTKEEKQRGRAECRSEITVGSVVELVNLNKMPALNGHYGTVRAIDTEQRRYDLDICMRDIMIQGRTKGGEKHWRARVKANKVRLARREGEHELEQRQRALFGNS